MISCCSATLYVSDIWFIWAAHESWTFAQSRQPTKVFLFAFYFVHQNNFRFLSFCINISCFKCTNHSLIHYMTYIYDINWPPPTLLLNYKLCIENTIVGICDNQLANFSAFQPICAHVFFKCFLYVTINQDVLFLEINALQVT